MSTVKLYLVSPEYADAYNHGTYRTRPAGEGEVDDGGKDYALPDGFTVEPWAGGVTVVCNEDGCDAGLFGEEVRRGGEWVMVPVVVGRGIHELVPAA